MAKMFLNPINYQWLLLKNNDGDTIGFIPLQSKVTIKDLESFINIEIIKYSPLGVWFLLKKTDLGIDDYGFKL
jgi:hypothetical protein